MACYYPLDAWVIPGQKKRVFQKPKEFLGFHKVPCGQCIGCRLDKALMWSVRCHHELKMSSNIASFITLTYDNAHIPQNNSLHYPDFQKFLKRLRSKYPKKNIRYYVAGEYGDQTKRPHYHAIIFNHQFDRSDIIYHNNHTDTNVYRSEQLSELWPYGFSSTGDVTLQSIGYVTRYTLKKITGKRKEEIGENGLKPYELYDSISGEIIKIAPEFNRMSLRPGIGKDWFDKYYNDLYPHDNVIINGKTFKVPRFYDKKYEEMEEKRFKEIKGKRIKDAMYWASDNTTERLEVKEKCKKRKLDLLERKL
jgi:hypothetical protein